jgi:hypothetical protein
LSLALGALPADRDMEIRSGNTIALWYLDILINKDQDLGRIWEQNGSLAHRYCSTNLLAIIIGRFEHD